MVQRFQDFPPTNTSQKKHKFLIDPSSSLHLRHNFYIFPRQEVGGDDPSNEFLCQTASIDFLAKYQFDFNVCIKEELGLKLVMNSLVSSLVWLLPIYPSYRV